MARSNSEPLQVFLIGMDSKVRSVHFDASGADGFNERYQRAFVGEPMKDKWKVWRGWMDNPLLRRGSFFNFFVGAIGMFPETVTRLSRAVLETGELLPFSVEDAGECTVLNVTASAANALDPERSVRRLLAGKWSMEPTKYVFRQGKLARYSLFRIPEHVSAVFCASGGGRSLDRDFYRQCQEQKLTGLTFEKVWQEPFP